jgi:hypothetical protein
MRSLLLAKCVRTRSLDNGPTKRRTTSSAFPYIVVLSAINSGLWSLVWLVVPIG